MVSRMRWWNTRHRRSLSRVIIELVDRLHGLDMQPDGQSIRRRPTADDSPLGDPIGLHQCSTNE